MASLPDEEILARWVATVCSAKWGAIGAELHLYGGSAAPSLPHPRGPQEARCVSAFAHRLGRGLLRRWPPSQPPSHAAIRNPKNLQPSAATPRERRGKERRGTGEGRVWGVEGATPIRARRRRRCSACTRWRVAGRHARSTREEKDEWGVKWRSCPWRVSRTTRCHRVSLLLFPALTKHHVPPLADNLDPVEAGPHISGTGRLRGPSQRPPGNGRRGPREQKPDSDRTARIGRSGKRTAHARPRHQNGRPGSSLPGWTRIHPRLLLLDGYRK
jgi:hypothetical protein